MIENASKVVIVILQIFCVNSTEPSTFDYDPDNPIKKINIIGYY